MKEKRPKGVEHEMKRMKKKGKKKKKEKRKRGKRVIFLIK